MNVSTITMENTQKLTITAIQLEKPSIHGHTHNDIAYLCVPVHRRLQAHTHISHSVSDRTNTKLVTIPLT